MSKNLQKLFPPPCKDVAPQGLYLAHDLRSVLSQDQPPLVCANFVTSLDGRIAVPRGQRLAVPGSITNDLDWRLFHELAAQADVILTSGRYLRDRSLVGAQEILDPRDAGLSDLRQWRKDRNLPDAPAVAIISASLDFSIPDVLMDGNRKVIVVTTESSDKPRMDSLRNQGIAVVTAGDALVCGRQMLDQLADFGFRVIYSAAGPRILHMLLHANALDRLYLTTAMRLIGGDPYSSIVEGPVLDIPTDMSLYQMYLDPDGAQGFGQMFLSFERRY